jgi:hypothetical protein
MRSLDSPFPLDQLEFMFTDHRKVLGTRFCTRDLKRAEVNMLGMSSFSPFR